MQEYDPYLIYVVCSLDRVIHFGENLGDQVKGRTTKKIKQFKELPYVWQVRQYDLSFNMFLFSCPQRFPRPSCPFGGKFGRTGKVSSNAKAKIVDGGALCNAPESTGSKVQYELYLFQEACSQTALSISGKVWRSVKGRSPKKLKLLIVVPLCSAPENTGSKLQHEPYLFSVECSQTKLSISGKFGRSSKGLFTEKAKIFHIGSLCSALESTGSTLQ